MLSPHISRCLPNCHISPSFVIMFFSSTSGTSSSIISGANILSISFISFSNPKRDISKSKSISSSFNNDKSHSAICAVLLSATRNAFICSGVKSSATIQGTVFIPSFLAAHTRVCPAIITPSESIIIGTLNPNSLMLSATGATALSFLRGFFS